MENKQDFFQKEMVDQIKQAIQSLHPDNKLSLMDWLRRETSKDMATNAAEKWEEAKRDIAVSLDQFQKDAKPKVEGFIQSLESAMNEGANKLSRLFSNGDKDQNSKDGTE